MFSKLAASESMPDPMTEMKKGMKYEAEIFKTNQIKQGDLLQVTFLLSVDFMKVIPFFGNFRVCYWNTTPISEHIVVFSRCIIQLRASLVEFKDGGVGFNHDLVT